MFTDIPWSSKYDALIEDIYELYNDIPFHNQKHVYDVFQLGVCLLVQNKNTFHSLTNIQSVLIATGSIFASNKVFCILYIIIRFFSMIIAICKSFYIK